jgi:hypothetical protein
MRNIHLIATTSLLLAACSQSEFAADNKVPARKSQDACGQEGQKPCGEHMSTDDNPSLANQVQSQSVVTDAQGNPIVGEGVSTGEGGTAAVENLNSCPIDVKIGAQHTYGNWENRLRSQTIAEAVVLPADATNIAISTVQFGVDDYKPYVAINDKEVLNLRAEAARKPRNFAKVVDLSAILKPGSNKLYVESFNATSLWAAHLQIKGTYSTAGACEHKWVFDNK